MDDFYAQVSRNKASSIILIFFFFALLGVIGFFFGVFFNSALFGLGFALIFAGIIFSVQYYKGDSLVLKVTGARPADPKNAKEKYLINTVEGLAIAAGIPMPKVYVIPETALNAFATGRDPNHSSIAVTSAMMDKMDRTELEGVISHEMSHIKNYDIRFMLLTVALLGVIVMVSDFMLRISIFNRSDSKEGGQAQIILLVIAVILAILAPIAAYLVHFAISRKREYLADASGAYLTRYPEGLASALEKIKNDKEPLVEAANRGTAPLFIANPLRLGKAKAFSGLFSTHPPIEDRIKRLREM